MKIIAKYFIIIILFTACQTTKVYHHTDGYNYSDNLILKKNSSFTQYIQGHHGGDTFYGNWSKYKDTLTLDFIEPKNINPHNPKNRVEERFTKNTDSITFYFYFEDTLQVEFPVHLILNNVQNESSKPYFKSVIQIPKDKMIKNIAVDNLVGYHYHKVKDTTANVFDIYLYYDTFLPSITRSNIINKWLFLKGKLYPINRNTKEVEIGDYYLKNKIFNYRIKRRKN